MKLPKITSLYFAPADSFIEARVVRLTAKLIPRVTPGWWRDPALEPNPIPPPIDCDWDWSERTIDWEGRRLDAERIAIVTGDGEVQGAMLLSRERVRSVVAPETGSLFLERLFSAPRNRQRLRKDRKAYFMGIGVELLTWAAEYSRHRGHSGRLRLDASPEAVGWYLKRGLQILDLKPIVFEGVSYTPMELSDEAAEGLISPPPRSPGIP